MAVTIAPVSANSRTLESIPIYLGLFHLQSFFYKGNSSLFCDFLLDAALFAFSVPQFLDCCYLFSVGTLQVTCFPLIRLAKNPWIADILQENTCNEVLFDNIASCSRFCKTSHFHRTR